MSKQKRNFINFWEFLEIPMNSPIKDIKLAFYSKFNKIEHSITSGENHYSLEDLNTCISAYETLSNPYSRFLHNCEIDGEEPPRDIDWDDYFEVDGKADVDLSEEEIQYFLLWLQLKVERYDSLMNIVLEEKNTTDKKLDITIETFREMVSRLYQIFMREQEKNEQKEKSKKKLYN